MRYDKDSPRISINPSLSASIRKIKVNSSKQFTDVPRNIR